jgi:hypothetical protein
MNSPGSLRVCIVLIIMPSSRSLACAEVNQRRHQKKPELQPGSAAVPLDVQKGSALPFVLE